MIITISTLWLKTVIEEIYTIGFGAISEVISIGGLGTIFNVISTISTLGLGLSLKRFPPFALRGLGSSLVDFHHRVWAYLESDCHLSVGVISKVCWATSTISFK